MSMLRLSIAINEATLASAVLLVRVPYIERLATYLWCLRSSMVLSSEL